jgi:aspartate aminotransferase
MFETLTRVPEDPILGVTSAFRRDTSPTKVDLGVGVYKDDSGNTPVPAAVRAAEQAVLGAQTSKTYLSPIGNPGFNDKVTDLVLGEVRKARGLQAAGVHGPGGSGALRLGAELLKISRPETRLVVSDPTWANHIPLLGGTGLAIDRYPYYSTATHSIDFDAMQASLERLPTGTVVVLHACCHNPTGADLTTAQWSAVADVMARRGLVPFLDLAYQGLAVDLDADVAGLRLLATRLPELLIAVSCSKNFGLYRERVGLVIVVTPSEERTSIATGQLGRIARTLYSMPPDHGAAIVDRVLGDAALKSQWVAELAAMTARINGLRGQLADALSVAANRDYTWIKKQYGMFSKLDATPAMVTALREEHHIYLAPDGRMNIAGLRADTVGRVAQAIAAVVHAAR